MSMIPEERAAEKEAQLARLAAKGTPEYPILYAQQPAQVRLREEAAVKRAAARKAQAAIRSLNMQDANASAAIFKGVNLTGGEG